jgi:uncharacterized protein YggE
MRARFDVPALLAVLSLACPALADDAFVVVVEGRAAIDVAPDLAYLSMGIEARDPDAQAAAAQVASGVGRVLAFTRELGIPDEHISTAAAEIHPEFDWNRPDGRAAEAPRLIGYVVRRQISVKLEDIEQIGRLTEGLLAAGVNSLSNAVFDTSRRDELEREAMGRAVADARLRAETLAAADGVSAGRARRLTSMRSAVPMVGRLTMAAEAGGGGAEETYQTGQIRIEARVQAEFELVAD